MEIIKDKNSYIFINGSMEHISKIRYEDFIRDTESGAVSIIEGISDCVEISTTFSKYFYKKTDSTLIKKYLDFEEFQFEVSSIKTIQENDYLFVLKNKFSDVFNMSVIDVSKYLYQGSYNISVIDKNLCSDIGVSQSFLNKSLLYGVPDHEYENKKLDEYVYKNGYSDLKEFKSKLLTDNVRPFKKKQKVTKSFIYFIVLFLKNKYNFSENNIVTFDIDQTLINFLDEFNINYSISDLIYINSSFIYSILKDEFNNLSFIYYLEDKLKNYFIKLLQEESFIVASEKTLENIKFFLFSKNIPSSIDEFGDSSIKSLSFLDSSQYVELESGFLFPVISIKNNTDTLIKITLS